MPNKSLYQQISNPIETYTDGYGQTREVYEPKYVGVLRKAYNLANRFLNGPSEENYQAMGIEKPIGDSGVIGNIAAPQSAITMIFSPKMTQLLKKTPQTYNTKIQLPTDKLTNTKLVTKNNTEKELSEWKRIIDNKIKTWSESEILKRK